MSKQENVHMQVPKWAENDESMTRHWETIARKALMNRKIVRVRYLTKKEMEHLGWYNRCVVLQLDNGKLVFPSMDDEGNNAGVLFTTDKGAETLPVL